MADDEWDTLQAPDNDRTHAGEHRWIWNDPVSAAQHMGADWHPTRAKAIRAGKQWLADRGKK
jgi:hypothetical protein